MIAAGAFLGACQDDAEHFDNKVYVNGASDVTNLLLDGETETASYTIQARIPQPANQEVSVTYAVDPTLVDVYNNLYGAKTVMLPEEFYSLPEPEALIGAGKVETNPVSLNLINLTNIDQDYTYCLPVTIAKSSAPMLTSMQTKYYIIRGASLINWVANLHENNLSLASPSGAGELSSLSQITVEALIRPGAGFGDGNDAGISTLLGIEGSALLRFGDAGVPSLQLQFANSSNVTNSQWTVETDKWQFITFTYDSSTGVCQFYLDGIQRGGDISSSNSSPVSWNSSQFYIGKSYSDNRDFSGDMAEVRIWNRVLTKEEIQAKNHFYKVNPESEGLVAYWKMNDGAGSKVTDYANGYDLNANASINWVEVKLPQ